MNNTFEANSYLDNAKQILRDKAKKKGSNYQDKKYVRMAGNTAYSGVLEALDELLGKKEKGRKSEGWYQKELAKIDRKMLNSFITVYNILHLSLGYDGKLNVTFANEGIKEAEKIINWVVCKDVACNVSSTFGY